MGSDAISVYTVRIALSCSSVVQSVRKAVEINIFLALDVLSVNPVGDVLSLSVMTGGGFTQAILSTLTTHGCA